MNDVVKALYLNLLCDDALWWVRSKGCIGKLYKSVTPGFEWYIEEDKDKAIEELIAMMGENNELG